MEGTRKWTVENPYSETDGCYSLVRCASRSYPQLTYCLIASPQSTPRVQPHKTLARRKRLRQRRTQPLRTPIAQHSTIPSSAQPSVDIGHMAFPRLTAAQCSFSRTSTQNWSCSQTNGLIDNGCAAESDQSARSALSKECTRGANTGLQQPSGTVMRRESHQ